MKLKLTHLIRIWVLAALLVVCIGAQPSPAQAQTLDPAIWQQSSTGMIKSPYGYVAGLGVIAHVTEGWPSLSIRGGAEGVGYGAIGGPVGIQLGAISVPGFQSATLARETTDWAHNAMTFTYGAPSPLKLWITRLSPAVLMQTQASSLRLLTGDVTGNEFYTNDYGQTDIRVTSGPSLPKYVAFPTGSQVQVQALGSAALNLNTMSGNWLLLWYGNNSHFLESKKPLSYSGAGWDAASMPNEEAYKADAPILVVFATRPTSIKHASTGGVEVAFGAPAGYMSILPLTGRNNLKASDTEQWSGGLPATIATRSNWWATRLCSYPVTVRESYSYNSASDTVVIGENFTFLNACSGGTRFAPVPPMLGIARNALGVVFSGPVTDAALPTEFGPTLGIENVSQYEWRVPRLAKYVAGRRTPGNGQVPADLQQSLDSEVDKLIAAGHMAPWLYQDDSPINVNRGDLYWANPGDILIHLVETAEALPDGARKNNLISYIKSERTAYPPETVSDLEMNPAQGGGTVRQNFSYYGENWEWFWTNDRADVHLSNVPLINFFALSRYYDLTRESLPSSVLTRAKSVLDRSMREQDWATSYWFYGQPDLARGSVINANRHLAGMLGFVRIADKAGDSQAETLGFALLAKAAVTRIGMALYPRYLYSAGLVELPIQANWHPAFSAGRWRGHLFNSDWTDAYDDARQVTILDQHEVYLYDHSGYMRQEYDSYEFVRLTSAHLTGYRDLVPEAARLLSDHARADMEVYADKFEAHLPHWYAAFAEATLGMEHNLTHPADSFQVFMAKAWIQHTPAPVLGRYLDIPWLVAGDLFYMQKLAETIKAYRGTDWEDILLLSATPGDRVLRLNWESHQNFPAGATWRIEYAGPRGDQASPITGIPIATRSYNLTGLTNYAWYTLTLSAVSGNTVVASAPAVTAMPTNRFTHIPLLKQSR